MTIHILVVDDDLAILGGITTLLLQAGYQTRAAASGTEALTLLDPPPHLIILDVLLPDLDGHTICQRIRQLSGYIPIIMLSACDELSDKVLGLELGADDYVTKPFEPRELLARIRALLRFAEQRQVLINPKIEENPISFGALRLWRIKHRVELNGLDIELTPTEWELLLLLTEHPGQVFGRETLLRHIWGVDFLGDSRTVDTHIQRLRAKLELNATHPSYIQTVRGFGYRFAAVEMESSFIR